jgi:hypothetical protein
VPFCIAGKQTFASRDPTCPAQSPSTSWENRKPCIADPGSVCRAWLPPSGRSPELPGKPPQVSRLHGIGRNDLVLYVVALWTFEPAILKGHGTMNNARKHQARRAARTARALDGCEGWAGGKRSSWHDAFPVLGGSVQHSQSPTDADTRR